MAVTKRYRRKKSWAEATEVEPNDDGTCGGVSLRVGGRLVDLIQMLR